MGPTLAAEKAITSSFLKQIAASGTSGFELAHMLAHETGNNDLARKVYRCAYGINELLLSSFKLHHLNRNDLVIDPWEVILTELAWLFDAPMVVARVKKRHSDNEGADYFIRTNVRNLEYSSIVGQRRRDCVLVEDGLIGATQRDDLINYYYAHSLGTPDAPLALDRYPGDECLTKGFALEKVRYDTLLKQLPNSERKQEIYDQFHLQNPALLSITGVVAVALYHVSHQKDQAIEFVGTVELYLPEPDRLPKIFRRQDLEKILGFVALPLSLVSLHGLCLNSATNNPDDSDDFDSYIHSPTAKLSDMPSFQEYGKDLSDYVERVVSGGSLAGDDMQSESSLPAVFNDLYLQMKRLFEREGYPRDAFRIAFVVPERPGFDGASVGRYYFPSKFIDDVFTPEVLANATKRERIKRALEALMVSGDLKAGGLSLDLGLLGYVRKTLFPAFTYNVNTDARAKSYDNTQQEQELELFSRSDEGTPEAVSVIEFPLVLFKDEIADKIYPTYLIAFLGTRDSQKRPPQSPIQLLSYRGCHHLYALIYHARYALAKAFTAEVYRESQVQQLSIVVHDMDRMNRLFTSSIVKTTALVDKLGHSSSSYTKHDEEALNNLKASAKVISDYLQMSQWIANRRGKDMKDLVSEAVVSQKLSFFQSMFDSVQQHVGVWPGWDEPKVVLAAGDDSYSLPDGSGGYFTDETRCKFMWPQGALIGILWNLAANAHEIYKDNIYKSGRSELIGDTRASIKCHIGTVDMMTNLADATFVLEFPGISFRLGDETKLGEFCMEPERLRCESCHHIGNCAPYNYGQTIFKQESSGRGRGMKSCFQSMRAWYHLMRTSHPGQPLKFTKAGRPERIEFVVPLEFIPHDLSLFEKR